MVETDEELADLQEKLDDAGAYRASRKRAMRARPSGAPAAWCPDPGLPCPTPSNSVSVAHVAQSTNFYCGPATGTMILRTTNEGTGAYDGDSLNQANVANGSHMRTDINGTRSWDSGLLRVGLDRWRFATSTLESSGGAHYNFRPTAREVGHWIVAQGRSEKLDKTDFDDPAANSAALSSSWSSVNA